MYNLDTLKLSPEEIVLRGQCHLDRFFLGSVLGYNLLDKDIHGSQCQFLDDNKGDDLLILEPRDHFKRIKRRRTLTVNFLMPMEMEIWICMLPSEVVSLIQFHCG